MSGQMIYMMDVESFSSEITLRNFDVLWNAFNAAKPEIVIHMAAQPIVRESYRNPVDTYHTNVMGTVHILEFGQCGECPERNHGQGL